MKRNHNLDRYPHGDQAIAAGPITESGLWWYARPCTLNTQCTVVHSFYNRDPYDYDDPNQAAEFWALFDEEQEYEKVLAPILDHFAQRAWDNTPYELGQSKRQYLWATPTPEFKCRCLNEDVPELVARILAAIPGAITPARRPTTIYRFYDASGRLLYVGIAGNPGRRFQQHAKDRDWWHQVTRSTMEHFPTREEAAAAEVAAIVTERPAHNVAHNVR